MQFIQNGKHTRLILMDQESITIDISVEKKCVLIPLNSNPLNAWIQIIKHLLRLIKMVITGEKGLYEIVFNNITQRDTMKKQQCSTPNLNRQCG